MDGQECGSVIDRGRLVGAFVSDLTMCAIAEDCPSMLHGLGGPFMFRY